MTKPSLPYLAGIFDGEGSIYVMRIRRTGDNIMNPGRQYYICVAVAMCKAEAIIREFARRFRGSVKVHRTKNGHLVHHWQAVSRCASQTLQALLPHLRVKRRQAILALRLQRHISRHKKGLTLTLSDLRLRERIRAEISSLNLVRGKRTEVIEWSRSICRKSSHVESERVQVLARNDSDASITST